MGQVSGVMELSLGLIIHSAPALWCCHMFQIKMVRVAEIQSYQVLIKMVRVAEIQSYQVLIKMVRVAEIQSYQVQLVSEWVHAPLALYSHTIT